MYLNALIGFIAGFILVGTSAQRTLSIGHGDIVKANIVCVINLWALHFFTKGEGAMLYGSLIGAVVVTTIMSIHYKKKRAAKKARKIEERKKWENLKTRK